jgi:hypothetical protein
MSKESKRALKKTISVLTMTTTILSLSGIALLLPQGAFAAMPADYGLTEGDVISAAGSDDPDVYIVNELGYKRLFLNPVIFGFYGHLGGFAAVKNVEAATRDAFGTSGLFRNCESGDEKVYGVETTGEDTAILHWVNTTGAQAVIDDADFFKKVFCINNNEFNWYSKGSDYTSVNDVPDYTRDGTVTPGAISVSIAPGNPAASTVTRNAQGLEFLRARLSGTGTISSMTFKRMGAGETNDFDNVYVYDGARRLVSGKTLSSSTGEVTFLLSLAVNGYKDISLVGDHDSDGTNTQAGNVNYFQLKEVVLSSGAVSGLPVTGNAMSVSGASSGTITLDKIGSLANPNAGATGVQMSEFKLSANTEASWIKRIQMLQGGTVKPADLTNLKLKTGSNEWAGSIDSAGYMVFDLGSGFAIAKGGNAIFKVYGDVAGKKDEIIDFYFEYATDVLGVGDQYGYGMFVTVDGNLDGAGTGHELTLQGGVLTISFDGPTAGDIGTNTSDTSFLQYRMTSAANIEIKKTRLLLSYGDEGGGFDDLDIASTLTDGFQDLDDIKIVDVDSGQVVAGPVDGSSFTVANTTGNPDGTGAGEYVFTDVIDLFAGTTRTFKVTVDVKTANTRNAGATSVSLDADDQVAVSLRDFSDNVGISEMKYTGTTTALAAADIVPNAHIHGSTMTIKDSSLTLGLAANPASQTVIKGSTDFDAIGFTMSAGAASDLTVTDITLTGYSSQSTTASDFDKGTTNEGAIASMVATVKLYDKSSGALIASGPTSNNLNAAAGTLVFNNLSWLIPAGSTKTLLVRVDLLNLAAATIDTFTFDIAATTDITALDKNSQTVNAGTATPNGAANPTVAQTFADAGTILVTEYDSSPSKQKNTLYWGQTGASVAQFKIRTVNEAFYLDKLNFMASTSDGLTATGTNAKANINAIHLEYKDENGSVLTRSGTINADTIPSVSFAFSGAARPYVAKNDYALVTVKVDTVDSYAAGATSAVATGIAFSGAAADEFEATGAGSGTKIYGAVTGTSETVDVFATNSIYVYRSFPKFTAVSMPNGATSGQAVIGKFDITAMGYDVLFSTTEATLSFDTLSSGSGTTSAAATLYDDATGQVLDTGTLDPDTQNASISFYQFGTSAFNVPAGTTKRVRVEADLSSYVTPVNTSSGLGADYFQLILQDEAGVVGWVDASGSGAADPMQNIAGYINTLPAYGPYLKGQ